MTAVILQLLLCSLSKDLIQRLPPMHCWKNLQDWKANLPSRLCWAASTAQVVWFLP